MRFYNTISSILKGLKEKGFFHLLSANILIQVVAFASQLFVAGILSPDNIGRIKIIQTFLSIFSILAGLGFNASTLKICSENRTSEEKNKVLSSGLIFTTISSIVIYSLLLLINSLYLFSSDTIIQSLMPIGLLPILTNGLFMIFVSYFQASKKIKKMSNITISNKLLSITGIIVATSFFGIYGYYFAYNISLILIVVVCFFWVKKQLDLSFKIQQIKSYFLLHWQYAGPSLFANILNELSSYLDIIFISYFASEMLEIGYYSFALTLTVILKIIPSTVQQITTPYFSALTRNKTEFIKVFRHYNKLLYIIVSITLLLGILLISPSLQFVFGDKYIHSIRFFQILAIGWSIRQFIQLQSGAMFGLGKIDYNMFTSLISLITNVLIYWVALNYWGLWGAAYGSIASGIVIWLTSSLFMRKALKSITE